MHFDTPRKKRDGWESRLFSPSTMAPQKRDENRGKAVLRGDVDGMFSGNWMEDRKRTIRCFFSASFSDTAIERRLLHQEVMPYVLECARNRAFEIMIVEACYGFIGKEPIEHTKRMDAKSHAISNSELLRCQKDSAGISFVLLTCDKYGFRPHPTKIPQNEFEELHQYLSIADVELVSSLYRLDTNNLECPEYSYQGCVGSGAYLERVQKAFRTAATALWADAESELRDASSNHRIKSYFVSVVEEEISRGLFWVPIERITRGVHVFRRSFEIFESFEALQTVDMTLDKLSDFVDVKDNEIDKEAYLLLREQQHRMLPIALVAASHVESGLTKYQALPWSSGGLDLSHPQHMHYLSAFLDDLTRTILDSLDYACDQLSIEADVILDECAHHLRFAKDCYERFHDSDSTRKVQSSIDRYLSAEGGNTFVLYGVSGAGKTWNIAKAIQRASMRARHEVDSVVMARFVGSSAASSNVRDMLITLCHQLYRLDHDDGVAVPQEIEALSTYFNQKLTSWSLGRLIMFLDGLDQLDDSDHGRLLNWLPLDGLSSLVYIVVTSAPDGLMATHQHPYHGMTILQNRMLMKENCVAMDAITHQPADLFAHMLKLRGRCACEAQQAVVLHAAQQTDPAQMSLFIKLAATRAATWESHYICQSTDLATSVRGLINQLFDSLIMDSTLGLVSATLSYITLAKQGVSETELRELLSLDDDVLADLYEWTADPIGMIPTWLLTILLWNLGPYLSNQGKSELLVWFHQQLKESAISFFLSDAEVKRSRHRHMSEFFIGKWAGKPKPFNARLIDCMNVQGVIEADRYVRHQPTIFNTSVWMKGAIINERRCAEAAHHMLEAGLWAEAADELCSFEGICSRAKCGEGYNMTRQMELLLQSVRKPDNACHAQAKTIALRVQHYARWLRQHIADIVRDPEFEVASSCSCQPMSSIPRNEFLQALPMLTYEPFSLNSWIVSLQVGVSATEFEALVATLRGHTDWVRSVSWKPDGKQLASASGDNTIRIWDTTTNSQIAVLMGHTDSIDCIAWSPDGTLLATSSCDTTIAVWDIGNFTQIASFQGHSEWVCVVVWSPDSRQLASCSGDKTARIWDLNFGQMLVLEGHTNWINCIAWRPDGQQIATASSDTTVLIWNAAVTLSQPSSPVAKLYCTHSVSWVSWRPDGKQLATTSDDRSYIVRIWDTEHLVQVAMLKGHTNLVSCVEWSPDGKNLATAAYDQTVLVWNAETSSQIATLPGHSDCVTNVAWSPDGIQLASCSGDATVKIWDVFIVPEQNSMVQGHIDQVFCVAWSPTGDRFVTASGDKTARIWNSVTLNQIVMIKGHAAGILSVAWCPDGEHLATAGRDKTAKIWKIVPNLPYATLVGTLWGHMNSVASVCWSPNGRRLATASDDKTARIWEVLSCSEAIMFTGHTDSVNCAAWRADGERLATGSTDSTVRIWDTSGCSSQSLVATLHCNLPVSSIAWRPDGEQLATASNIVLIWDPLLETQTAIVEGHMSSVTCVTWSPDGQQLATASHDLTIRVWDAVTGCDVVRLYGSSKDVLNVAWSPDGRRLASASGNSARLWAAAVSSQPWPASTCSSIADNPRT